MFQFEVGTEVNEKKTVNVLKFQVAKKETQHEAIVGKDSPIDGGAPLRTNRGIVPSQTKKIREEPLKLYSFRSVAFNWVEFAAHKRGFVTWIGH
jgi:hypothetical protein